MTETRRFPLPWVVAAPVEQDTAEKEQPVGVVIIRGVVYNPSTVLPVQQVVNKSVHQGLKGFWFPFDTLPALAGFADSPEVTGVQARQVHQPGHERHSSSCAEGWKPQPSVCACSVPEFLGQMVGKVCDSEQQGSDGPAVLTPEQRDAITHAHQCQVTRLQVQARVCHNLYVEMKTYEGVHVGVHTRVLYSCKRRTVQAESVCDARQPWYETDGIWKRARAGSVQCPRPTRVQGTCRGTNP